MMNTMIKFFNELAVVWDEICLHDEAKITKLLDLVNITKNATMLDVGCGTGVLEKYLLAYDPKAILAVDVAQNMIEQAKTKYDDQRITFECNDVMLVDENNFEYIFIYSAFPHLMNQDGLFEKLSSLLIPGGKLVIFHSESKEKINSYHKAKAAKVSENLPSGLELSLMIRNYFDVEIMIDSELYYMIVGRK